MSKPKFVFEVYKEIINLWYETIYQRSLLSLILASNGISSEILNEKIDIARKNARDEMNKKFPDLDLKFEE